ncbi:MAG: DUF364 domain-containing protein [bacterium]
MDTKNIYDELKDALRLTIQKYAISGKEVSIRCKVLSAEEAIGRPEHNDYPIIKGREVMVEAVFEGASGQAFADDFENADYTVDELLNLETDSNRKRASFVSGLNAIYRYLGLCDKTVHCKDAGPKECAENLKHAIKFVSKVLLVGHQPRFLQYLSQEYNVRVVDLDKDNIGKEVYGIIIEPAEMTEDAITWCDIIFVTGSTLINGTITNFLNREKPALFYGVTISAAAKILGLKTYCHCGL